MYKKETLEFQSSVKIESIRISGLLVYSFMEKRIFTPDLQSVLAIFRYAHPGDL